MLNLFLRAFKRTYTLVLFDRSSMPVDKKLKHESGVQESCVNICPISKRYFVHMRIRSQKNEKWSVDRKSQVPTVCSKSGIGKIKLTEQLEAFASISEASVLSSSKNDVSNTASRIRKDRRLLKTTGRSQPQIWLSFSND